MLKRQPKSNLLILLCHQKKSTKYAKNKRGQIFTHMINIPTQLLDLLIFKEFICIKFKLNAYMFYGTERNKYLTFQVLQISPVLGGFSKSFSQLCQEIYGEKIDFFFSISTLKWFRNAKKSEKNSSKFHPLHFCLSNATLFFL